MTPPKRKRKIYQRRWRKLNPERAKSYWQRQNATRKVVQQEIVDCLKSEPCTDCKQYYPPWVMEFDHVPERGPVLFRINPNLHQPLGEFIDEIIKCDVVCANCHANRTHVRRLKPR